MAGSEWSLDIRELDKISEAFTRASSLNTRQLLSEIGVEEEGQIKERFETKQDPDGNKWDAWSEPYRKRQALKNPGASILMGKNARLQESITFEAKSYGIVWGSALIYARVHQAGYEEKNIPARSCLGIGEEDEMLIGETVESFIQRESGGLY